MFNVKNIFGFMAVAIFVLTISLPAYAVRIVPPRVVMQPGDKVAYVYVNNDGVKTETYRFSWMDIAMAKDGEVINLSKFTDKSVPAYRPVSPHIRFSPRQTTVLPGQTQRITLFMRRAPDLPDGEYRSHFLVQRMPDTVKDSENKQGDADGTKVGAQLLVSRSFPVYVMNGNVQGALSVDDARFVYGDKAGGPDNKKPYFAEVSLSKTGNRSMLGNIAVLCGEEPIHVSPKIISLYAEVDANKERVLLDERKAKSCSAPHAVVTAHPDDLAAGTVWGDVPVRP